MNDRNKIAAQIDELCPITASRTPNPLLLAKINERCAQTSREVREECLRLRRIEGAVAKGVEKTLRKWEERKWPGGKATLRIGPTSRKKQKGC
jgi:hypothetical protein